VVILLEFNIASATSGPLRSGSRPLAAADEIVYLCQPADL
jgi:hypothetical protein